MKLFFQIVFVFFLVGNSSFQSKWGMGPEEPHQIGHIYSGITHNLGGWCSNKNPKINMNIKVFNFALNIIDFPMSLIIDTIFLPIDLLVTPKHKRLTSEQICKVHISKVK